MDELEGKVAFITGAARGQGANHALRLAEQGVDIIAVDVNASLPTVPYPGPGPDELASVAEQVRSLGRRCFTRQVDVRDADAVRSAVDDGVAELGRLDIVVPNAGIASIASVTEMTHEQWHTMIDINLNGAWHAVSAALPHVRAGGRGGAIVLIGSTASLTVLPGLAHYTAAKHAIIGVSRTLALELGPERIRVNAICPGNVDTPMVVNEQIMRLFMPELEAPTRADAERPDSAYVQGNVIPVPWIDVDDVTNALLFLVSDRARYITGVALPVDAGFLLK
jgi:SDR family mycofactocin-dependent oxidoreductase